MPALAGSAGGWIVSVAGLRELQARGHEGHAQAVRGLRVERESRDVLQRRCRDIDVEGQRIRRNHQRVHRAIGAGGGQGSTGGADRGGDCARSRRSRSELEWRGRRREEIGRKERGKTEHGVGRTTCTPGATVPPEPPAPPEPPPQAAMMLNRKNPAIRDACRIDRPGRNPVVQRYLYVIPSPRASADHPCEASVRTTVHRF